MKLVLHFAVEDRQHDAAFIYSLYQDARRVPTIQVRAFYQERAMPSCHITPRQPHDTAM